MDIARFKEITNILASVEDHDTGEEPFFNTVSILGFLAAGSWFVGLYLSKVDFKLYAIGFYIIAIGLGVVSSILGFRDIRVSFKNPIRDQVLFLQDNKNFLIDIHKKLIHFDGEDLSEVLDDLVVRRERLENRLRWIYGPVRNLGFLPAVAAVGIAILELYNTTGPIVITPIVSGLAIGFMLALVMFGRILGWHEWSETVLKNAIKDYEVK